VCQDNVRLHGSEQKAIDAFVREKMSSGPIALVPEKANEQHYEVPQDFYHLCLGPVRKYSSCFFGPLTAPDDLGTAELIALGTTASRAQVSSTVSINLMYPHDDETTL
jgi:cyclopropane-fatty-acyl-phospholipid synthase